MAAADRAAAAAHSVSSVFGIGKIASSVIGKGPPAKCGHGTGTSTSSNMTNPRKYRDKIKIQEEKMKLQQQEFERTMLEVSPIYERRVIISTSEGRRALRTLLLLPLKSPHLIVGAGAPLTFGSRKHASARRTCRTDQTVVATAFGQLTKENLSLSWFSCLANTPAKKTGLAFWPLVRVLVSSSSSASSSVL